MWRCRARLPNVLASFLKYLSSSVGRRLSLREGDILKEVNDSVFALNFLVTGGIGCSSVKSEVLHVVHRTCITCISSSPLCDS